jgi:hypothetical protein
MEDGCVIGASVLAGFTVIDVLGELALFVTGSESDDEAAENGASINPAVDKATMPVITAVNKPPMAVMQPGAVCQKETFGSIFLSLIRFSFYNKTFHGLVEQKTMDGRTCPILYELSCRYCFRENEVVHCFPAATVPHIQIHFHWMFVRDRDNKRSESGCGVCIRLQSPNAA